MRVNGLALLRALTSGVAALGAAPCAVAAGSSEFVDKAASFLALFIIIVLPIGGIALFWLVHVLPEKIAEKRQHPQKDAIHVLCLLSLVFGGMLWPLAWLWAYSKPVLHKMAYGRDKHDEYYEELERKSEAGVAATALHEELGRLQHDVEELEKRGESPEAMQMIRKRLASLESRLTPDAAAEEGVR
jgi:CBS domain containing-hemolysin-like protein